MAAGSSFQELSEEVTCSICLEFFKDPVTIAECGHNFCRVCLTQYWGELATEGLCPQCRKRGQQRNLIPNRPLANVVEILAAEKCHSQEEGKGTEDPETICEKHQEPLRLFCRNDVIPICELCNKSQEHRDHEVISVEEAEQEYKDQIHTCLHNLREVEEKILSSKADALKESQHLLEQAEEVKQTLEAKYQRLHQLLEEQEKVVLFGLEKVKEEIEQKREEHLARMSRELSSLKALIQEMEERCQQPASGLLEDMKSILQRSEMKEKFEKPVPFPSILKWLIWTYWDDNSLLKGIGKQLKANLTFDPVTAHPCLILSEDHKSLKLGENDQDLPKNPERFDQFPIVLGTEGFSSGRHFWDVIVGPEEEWAVGVARKSVRRKGPVAFGAVEGIWVIGKWLHGYLALNYPDFTLLRRGGILKRIRVFLNYTGGQVAFFDLKKAELLFAFSEAEFLGEPVYPFFWLNGKAVLRFLSDNRNSLRRCPTI
ncbi:E3 ubiquitin-protein ligase TRIM11-like isoform X2 [Sceloporus undulatus]|uniref:E3 ubiquitin-protein ligase TRIM11-like isoform X2 n=1 Tax=Sceloporus undulatus TaxID=8520 RepID=UPI001C4BF64F|nr:E3 ubiquitin-protein ligase TRIM11-like isoform X2 [Sceloporus undulatus]